MSELDRQIARRRTFAIISHPDAGKTTLTEKLLLYGGALHQAGAVKSRKADRAAASDWMDLEQKRGISITSSVLQFFREGIHYNLLDTPGHQDFSEDTYRTLMAADSAVMLIDAAKGVEAQTRKLFEVCRFRHIPIFTFVNKMDRLGRDPLDLMSEIEEGLGIDAMFAEAEAKIAESKTRIDELTKQMNVMVAKKVGHATTVDDVYEAYPDIEKEVDDEIDKHEWAKDAV